MTTQASIAETKTNSDKLEQLRPDENANDLAAAFILDQDFDAAMGLESTDTGPELKRPAKHEWFRVLPEVKWPAFLLKAGEGRDDQYVVTTEVFRLVPDHCYPIILRVVCNSAMHKYLWPLRVPDAIKPHAAHTSALVCAEAAEQSWINMIYRGKDYQKRTAEHPMPEPEWPDDPRQLLNLTLEVFGITDPKHEVIKRLMYGG